MFDFIGNEFTPGGWVAVTGSGNLMAEYGAILHKVLNTNNGKLRLRRLVVTYLEGVAHASYRDISISAPNKYVVVCPKQSIVDLFEAVAGGTATKEQEQKVGRWLHGGKVTTWE